MIIGFSSAAPLSAFFGYFHAFFVNGFLFLLSAFTLFFVKTSGVVIKKENFVSISSIPKLFQSESRFLAISHGLAAAALYVNNSTSLFVLKDEYHLNDYWISSFYSLQAVVGISGSLIFIFVVGRRSLGYREGFWLRIVYALAFAIAAISTHRMVFAFGLILLYGIHTFSIPL